MALEASSESHTADNSVQRLTQRAARRGKVTHTYITPQAASTLPCPTHANNDSVTDSLTTSLLKTPCLFYSTMSVSSAQNLDKSTLYLAAVSSRPSLRMVRMVLQATFSLTVRFSDGEKNFLV